MSSEERATQQAIADIYRAYSYVVSDESTSSVSRPERALAYMLAVFIIISLCAFLAIIVGTWSGMSREDFGLGVWPFIAMAPYVGLPLAMIALIVLMVVGALRRSRETKRSQGSR